MGVESIGNRLRVKLLRFALVLNLAWSPAIWAWNDSGHMLIALDAFDQLPLMVRERLGSTLRKHPRYVEDFVALMPQNIRRGDRETQTRWAFAFSGTWPDLARRFEHVTSKRARRALVNTYNRPRWHYINWPVFLAPDDRAALQPAILKEKPTWQAELDEHELNLLQAIEFLMRSTSDGTLPDAKRGLYLSWLVHLVADLHQPLHDATLYAHAVFPRGDHGGNDIRVTFPEDAEKAQPHAELSLHWLWDSALGREVDLVKLGLLKEQLQHGSIQTDSVEPSISDCSSSLILSWSHSAHDLADSLVYSQNLRDQIADSQNSTPFNASAHTTVKSRTVRLSEQYRSSMVPIAEQQALLAGRRLAGLLRCLYGGPGL